MTDIEAKRVSVPSDDEIRRRETGVLLKRPTYHSKPPHGIIYSLEGGRVGTLPVELYKLPESMRDHVAIIPGTSDDAGIEILPILAGLADRIAPWIKVHVVPAVIDRGRHFSSDVLGYYEVDGRRFESVGGLAIYEEDLVLITLGNPTWMLEALCHELMHHVFQYHLNDAAKETLKQAAENGILWPTEYYNSDHECVSRMFESYATARALGVPLTLDTSQHNVNWILEQVWRGDVADQAIINDAVPGSDALLARRGLIRPRPTTPKRSIIDVAVYTFSWCRGKLQQPRLRKLLFPRKHQLRGMDDFELRASSASRASASN